MLGIWAHTTLAQALEAPWNARAFALCVCNAAQTDPPQVKQDGDKHPRSQAAGWQCKGSVKVCFADQLN